MSVYTIVLAVTILVPLAVAGSRICPVRCSENAACPTGSECVDHVCTVCAIDVGKCMRSVDRCKNLNCASDQGCYVFEQGNADGSVTLKLGCAKTNPCAGVTCQNSYCENVFLGYQPPFAQCRPFTPVNPCNDAKCPNGSKCVTRAGLCGNYPCLVEGICVDTNDCLPCNYFYQCCEVAVHNNVVKGTCTNFMQPFVPRWNWRK